MCIWTERFSINSKFDRAERYSPGQYPAKCMQQFMNDDTDNNQD
jgi:hypothetical protein